MLTYSWWLSGRSARGSILYAIDYAATGRFHSDVKNQYTFTPTLSADEACFAPVIIIVAIDHSSQPARFDIIYHVYNHNYVCSNHGDRLPRTCNDAADVAKNGVELIGCLHLCDWLLNCKLHVHMSLSWMNDFRDHIGVMEWN